MKYFQPQRLSKAHQKMEASRVHSSEWKRKALKSEDIVSSA